MSKKKKILLRKAVPLSKQEFMARYFGNLEEVERARKEFLNFVRIEQTFEEARLMLERVEKQLEHSPMKPLAERLLVQVAAFKKRMRDE